MAVPETVHDARSWSELIIALGAAIMALAYGITRVYKMAKNVDNLVDLVKKNGDFAERANTVLNKVQEGQQKVSEDLQEVKAHVERLQSWQDKEDGRKAALHDRQRIACASCPDRNCPDCPLSEV